VVGEEEAHEFNTEVNTAANPEQSALIMLIAS
jgi:hypothetical protein